MCYVCLFEHVNKKVVFCSLKKSLKKQFFFLSVDKVCTHIFHESFPFFVSGFSTASCYAIMVTKCALV